MPRKRVETVAFPLRLRPELKTALELAARRHSHSRSINSEIQDRLEASFAAEAQAGSPEIQEIMAQVLAAFLHGGRLGAISRGHPEWQPEEWMRDELARKVAMAAGADVLVRVEKISAAADDPAAMERLVTTMIAWGMPAKLTEGDK
jgi:hypothetical protein